MSIELFAIGSSGLALVVVVLMVLSNTDSVPLEDAQKLRDRTPRS